MLAECSPEDVRALGEELTQRTEPASIRAGISRLYYASHLHAVETLVPKYDIQLRGKGDDHGAIIAWLKKRGGRTLVWSQVLSKLRTYREHADYHLNNAHSRDDCPICMGRMSVEALAKVREEAERCFDALGRL